MSWGWMGVVLKNVSYRHFLSFKDTVNRHGPGLMTCGYPWLTEVMNNWFFEVVQERSFDGSLLISLKGRPLL